MAWKRVLFRYDTLREPTRALLMRLGYLAWEYPTNRLLQRLPLAKYSAFCIIMWGATLSCFAAVQNFAGAVAVRFFLGLFEAAVSPGFALFTSQVRVEPNKLGLGLTVKVVHEERTRFPNRDMVLIQRVWADIWRSPRIRHRKGRSASWSRLSTVENYLSYYWALDPEPWCHIPLRDA